MVVWSWSGNGICMNLYVARRVVPHKVGKYVMANGNFKRRDHHREDSFTAQLAFRRNKKFIVSYIVRGKIQFNHHIYLAERLLNLPSISTVCVISRGSRVAIWQM